MMRGRVLGLAVAGMLLLVAAATVASLQVNVRAEGLTAACGTPVSVMSGRADWQVWYGQDLADPRIGVHAPLVRTEECPTAVNRRTLLAGTLLAAGAVAAFVAIVLAVRSRPSRPRADALRALARAITAVGLGLTVVGLIALCLLLANPGNTLFLYVDRWVVAVTGLIVLTPAMALAAGGRALALATNHPATDRRGHGDDHA
jgi:hypothetical protein